MQQSGKGCVANVTKRRKNVAFLKLRIGDIISVFEHTSHVPKEMKGMEFCCDVCNALNPEWYYKTSEKEKFWSMCVCESCAADLGASAFLLALRSLIP